jgi:hypothetical protein
MSEATSGVLDDPASRFAHAGYILVRLRATPFVGRAPRRMPDALDVRCCTLAQFPSPFDCLALGWEHVAGSIGVGSPDGIVAFISAFHVYPFVLHLPALV